MRVMLMVVAVSMLFAVGCKKKDQEAAVDVAAAATTPVSVAAAQAAGGAACPACPAAPTCPECAVCPDPNALTKAALGADGATLKVAAPAGMTFTVEKAGEYQIDAKAAEGDPVLRLYKGDENVGMDDDGGVDRNSRLYTFLAAGDYVVRVSEVEWKPVEAKVTVAEAPAITAAGSVAVGAETEVTLPEGTDDVRNIQEVTLEIATAGKYRIDASAGEDFDPTLTLIKDMTIVDQNDDFDSSVNRDARIEADLQPGTYIIRVSDVHNGAATVKVAVAAVTE